MKRIFPFVWLILALSYCNEPFEANDNIRAEILIKGKSITWALNEGNVDTLMDQYWQSDSALFVINGRQIEGYDQIENRLIQSLEYRKNLDLDVSSEDVMILSPTSATHIVRFKQSITDLNDNESKSIGIWTAIYRKIDGNWKAVLVHESYYPTED